jgi:hypothetical protein
MIFPLAYCGREHLSKPFAFPSLIRLQTHFQNQPLTRFRTLLGHQCALVAFHLRKPSLSQTPALSRDKQAHSNA